MSDIATTLKEAIDKKQNILLTFNDKNPTGVSKPIFGIVVFGRMFMISRSRK